jgi:Mce-associated membrane protein
MKMGLTVIDTDTTTKDTPDEKSVDAATVDDYENETAAEAGAADLGTARGAEKAAADERTGIDWRRMLVYSVLPGLAMVVAICAGFLKWQDSSTRQSQVAAIEAVQAATDSTAVLLSYGSDTAEEDLTVARERLTGSFRDDYTSLTKDVVIPGAKQKQISTVATVQAAASESASPSHAVVLVFVNQTVNVGQEAPTKTASSVRVTLDRVHGRWLISQFDPV